MEYIGMKWKNIKSELEDKIIVDKDNIDKNGECIIDFIDFEGISIRGKQEKNENENIYIIDDEAIIYKNS